MADPIGAAPGLLDEASLIRDLRSRSPSAFEQLVRVHGVDLMATARRLLRDEHEANDALQEAFLCAFRAIEGFDGRCPIGAWLRQITVNACLMRLRSKRRRQELEVEELLPAFTETGQFVEHQQPWCVDDARLERFETAQLVRQSIERLPQTLRVPLVLRDLEAMDYEDIAEQLGATVNAVKIRVHRARQALKTLLDPIMSETAR